MSGEATLFGQERWTATELGEALCLTPQRINGLVREGVLPAPVEGRYLPREAVSKYVQHIRQREAGKWQAGEAVRRMRLENEMREIRLRKIAGELVPLERVKKDWFEVSRRVRDGLLNLPSRLAGPFAAEASQEKIFTLFTEEIHEVLTELSSGQAAPPVSTRLPLDEATGLEQSPHETGAVDERVDRDVQGPKEINGESAR